MWYVKRNIGYYVLASLIMLNCCSCQWTDEGNYVDKLDEIKKVEIVELGEYHQETYQFDYCFSFEITNIQEFLEEFSNVERHTYWGDPHSLYQGEIVIKIVYKNDDYDLVGADAQYEKRKGIWYDNFLRFDEAQFKALIDKYISE